MDYVILRLWISNSIFLVGWLLSVVYIIRKRKFIYRVYLEKKRIEKKYSGKNDILFLRILNCIPFISLYIATIFMMNAILDIPAMLSNNYRYVEGVTVYKSYGGANVSSEKRSIFLRDTTSKKQIEITVFSKYIDANEYEKVQYLPHTKYGVILEN